MWKNRYLPPLGSVATSVGVRFALKTLSISLARSRLTLLRHGTPNCFPEALLVTLPSRLNVLPKGVVLAMDQQLTQNQRVEVGLLLLQLVT